MKKEERNKQGGQLENGDQRARGRVRETRVRNSGRDMCVCLLPYSPCISEMSDALHLFLAVLETVLIPRGAV